MTTIRILLLAMLSGFPLSGNIYAKTELPGDNFNLEAALDLFKKVKSPEHYEELLNNSTNNVNNLDLDNDGNVDYIRVTEHYSGDSHAFVLQDVVAENEIQDVAVIEIEKNGPENVTLQIVGDETLFGPNKIVEPYENSGASDVAVRTGDVSVAVSYNVWAWPCVRFIYRPAYRPWVSPWRWRVYPHWWHPWRPYPATVFTSRRPVFAGYRVAPRITVVHAHAMYTPVRSTSVTVRNTHVVKVNSHKTVSVKRRTEHGHKHKAAAAKVHRARR